LRGLILFYKTCIKLEKRIIGIAADHAGYFLKCRIIEYFRKNNIEYKDFGAHNDESSDYPEYAHLLAASILSGECGPGISICGTGNGINMTVNKHQEIRSALCWNEEIARLARAHNDANICALPGRYITEPEAILIVRTFLSTDFEGGRHLRRILKIPLKNC